jgi:hypothetical protein
VNLNVVGQMYEDKCNGNNEHTKHFMLPVLKLDLAELVCEYS